jgi:hypothetical protein
MYEQRQNLYDISSDICYRYNRGITNVDLLPMEYVHR